MVHFPHIICDRCNQCGHIYRHCWDRIPPSGTASPPKAVITTEDNHHAIDTLEIDVMTEATADLMLGLIQETEVQATQDTPVQTDTPLGTETPDEGTCLTATKLKANHPTDSDQVAIDH